MPGVRAALEEKLRRMENEPERYSAQQTAAVREKIRRMEPTTAAGMRSAALSSAGTTAKDFGVGMLESIPMAVGAVGGGALGGMSPPGNVPGMIGGAMAGAAAGEAGYQAAKLGVRELGIALDQPWLAPLTPPPATTEEATSDIAHAAVMGPTQVSGKIVKAMGPRSVARIKPTKTGYAELAAEFDVPMTKAQQTQGVIRSAFESLVRRTFLGAGMMKKFDQFVNRRMVKATQRMARDISGKDLNATQIGDLAQESVLAAEVAIGRQYGVIVDEIIKRGGNVQIPVTGDLAKTARLLLDQLKRPTEYAPGLRKAEGLSTAIGILDDFANPTKTIKRYDFLVKKQASKTVTKSMTFEDAKVMRTLLYKLKESGEMNIGKGSLAQLNKALDGAMQQGLKNAGKADLAKTFHAVSTKFRETTKLLETKIMQAVAKSEKPEAILDMMMANPESTMKTFNALVRNKQTRAAVQRGFLEGTFTKAFKQTEGVVVGDKLEKLLHAIPDEALAAMFDKSHLAKLRRFSELSHAISLRSSLTRPVSAESTSLMAMMQGGAAVSLASLWQSPEGYMLGASTLLVPVLMARIMTRPAAVEVLTKALTTPRTTQKGADLVIRILGFIEQAKQEAKPPKLRVEEVRGQFAPDPTLPQLTPPPI